MEQKQYSIAKVSDILGYKPYVIRFYEKEFELNIPRNKANHRYFTENEIGTLKQIKELQERGYSNKQIKTIMKSAETGQQIFAHLEGLAATAQDIYPSRSEEDFRVLIEKMLENSKKEIVEEFKKELEFNRKTITMAVAELTESINELSRKLGDMSRNVQASKDRNTKTQAEQNTKRINEFQQK